jgi:hypothetical protein
MSRARPEPRRKMSNTVRLRLCLIPNDVGIQFSYFPDVWGIDIFVNDQLLCDYYAARHRVIYSSILIPICVVPRVGDRLFLRGTFPRLSELGF